MLQLGKLRFVGSCCLFVTSLLRCILCTAWMSPIPRRFCCAWRFSATRACVSEAVGFRSGGVSGGAPRFSQEGSFGEERRNFGGAGSGFGLDCVGRVAVEV